MAPASFALDPCPATFNLWCKYVNNGAAVCAVPEQVFVLSKGSFSCQNGLYTEQAGLGVQQSLFCSMKSSAGTSPRTQGQQLVLSVTAQALGAD